MTKFGKQNSPIFWIEFEERHRMPNPKWTMRSTTTVSSCAAVCCVNLEYQPIDRCTMTYRASDILVEAFDRNKGGWRRKLRHILHRCVCWNRQNVPNFVEFDFNSVKIQCGACDYLFLEGGHVSCRLSYSVKTVIESLDGWRSNMEHYKELYHGTGVQNLQNYYLNIGTQVNIGSAWINNEKCSEQRETLWRRNDIAYRKFSSVLPVISL